MVRKKTSKIPSRRQLTDELSRLQRESAINCSVEDAQQIQLIRNALRLYLEIERVSSDIKITPPSVEWYTPGWAIDLVRQVSPIDIDPASNETAQRWIKARTYWTKEDDGLVQPWSGFAFCNPPYGREYPKFMDRALDLYRRGDISGAIFLLNRSGSQVYRSRAEQFDAIAQVHKRIAFIAPNGKAQTGPTRYNDFLYLGPNPERFKQVFEQPGPGQSTVNILEQTRTFNDGNSDSNEEKARQSARDSSRDGSVQGVARASLSDRAEVSKLPSSSPCFV